MKNRLIFDCETAPLPPDQLDKIMPEFEANKTLKDPDKITADLAKKKEKWLADAALSPVTGRVLCVGFLANGIFGIVAEPTETGTLKAFWSLVETAIADHVDVIGWNCDDFDCPFLYARSYANGVPIPRIVGWLNHRRWNWNEAIIDLRAIWQLGSRQREGSLDVVSKLCGGAGKGGNGADFAGLWESDREAALAYLKNDLEQTKLVAARLLGDAPTTPTGEAGFDTMP